MENVKARTYHPLWYFGYFEYILTEKSIIESWKGLNANIQNEYALSDIKEIKKNRFIGTREAGTAASWILTIGLLISLFSSILSFGDPFLIIIITLVLFIPLFLYRFYKYQYCDIYSKSDDMIIGIRFSRRNKRLVRLISEIEKTLGD